MGKWTDINYKPRWINEDYIHGFYPKWDLSKMPDDQIYAIACRLRNNLNGIKETPSDGTYGDAFHQITIEEYLGGVM